MMLAITLNAAFGAGCLFFALRAFRLGWPFLRDGWLAIRAQANQGAAPLNIEQRRLVSEGGRFLIGGVLWLGAGIIGALAGIYFTVQAYQLMYGG